jgi:hypothetical protein
VYAFVAAATGWTWEYIGQCLTLPRLFAMYSVWNKYPPLIVAGAALLGIKADDTPAIPQTRDGIAKAMADAAIRLAQATTTDPAKLRWVTVPQERP